VSTRGFHLCGNRFTDVPKSDEEQLIAAIAGGPVSVAVEADQAAWQHYASGVITGPCGDQLDHGVLAVGYTEKYIMVKNSWGSAWGMDGFVRAPPTRCALYSTY
jgi:xylem cysteine proteinase